jgi:DNA-directed RNA polymerase specialized sigma24 family protein
MLDRPALQRLFRYGFSLTHDTDSAYDLLQDALEISLRKAPTRTDAPMRYVQSIMRNRFIDQYRREHRHPRAARCCHASIGYGKKFSGSGNPPVPKLKEVQQHEPSAKTGRPRPF